MTGQIQTPNNDTASQNTSRLNETGSEYNETDTDIWRENEAFARTLVPAMLFLAVVMVVGAIGNTLVVYVYTVRFRVTTQHFLIVCLACSDLLICLLAMPTEIADLRFHYTFSSEHACRLLRFITMFCAIVSNFVLIVIAVDRYRRICHPLRRQISLREARWGAAFSVLGALGISWPLLVLTGLRTAETQVKGLYGQDCSFSDTYKHTKFPLAFNATLGAGFVLMTIALAVLYFQIWRQARAHRAKRTEGRMAFVCIHSSSPSSTRSASGVCDSPDLTRLRMQTSLTSSSNQPPVLCAVPAAGCSRGLSREISRNSTAFWKTNGGFDTRTPLEFRRRGKTRDDDDDDDRASCPSGITSIIDPTGTNVSNASNSVRGVHNVEFERNTRDVNGRVNSAGAQNNAPNISIISHNSSTQISCMSIEDSETQRPRPQSELGKSSAKTETKPSNTGDISNPFERHDKLTSSDEMDGRLSGKMTHDTVSLHNQTDDRNLIKLSQDNATLTPVCMQRLLMNSTVTPSCMQPPLLCTVPVDPASKSPWADELLLSGNACTRALIDRPGYTNSKSTKSETYFAADSDDIDLVIDGGCKEQTSTKEVAITSGLYPKHASSMGDSLPSSGEKSSGSAETFSRTAATRALSISSDSQTNEESDGGRSASLSTCASSSMETDYSLKQWKRWTDKHSWRLNSKGSESPRILHKGRQSSSSTHSVDKTTIVAFAVTLVFVISFLPYLALMFVRAVIKDFDYMLHNAAQLNVYNIFIRFYLLSSAANPIIYGVLNAKFRTECWTLCRRFCICFKPSRACALSHHDRK